MKSWSCAAKSSSGLCFWFSWFAIGVGLILLVVYLSLANIHLPQVPLTIGDKINHLFAYGVLCIWFGQLFKNHRQRNLIAFGLVLLGILMEVLQGFTSHRFFDLLDACANTLGVCIGLLMLYCGADKILRWFERDVLKIS